MMLDDLPTKHVGVTRKPRCRCCTSRETNHAKLYYAQGIMGCGRTCLRSRVALEAKAVPIHIDDMTCEGPETRARCPDKAPNEHTRQAFKEMVAPCGLTIRAVLGNLTLRATHVAQTRLGRLRPLTAPMARNADAIIRRA